MDTRFLSLVGPAVLGLGALAFAWWSFSVDTDVPAVEIATAPTVATHQPFVFTPSAMPSPRPRGERKGKRGKKRDPERQAKKAGKKGGKAKASGENVEKKRDMSTEELAWARQEYREQRLMDMNDRLGGYAADAGWDMGTTEEVQEVLVDSMDKITDQLALVDAGEIEWDDLKADLRDFREKRAQKVQRLLGPDEWGDFVDGMGFDRFEGDEPVRGRLEGRKKGGRR